MWIGIIDKSIYGPAKWVETKPQSLFYYHNHRIHAFSYRHYEGLPPQDAYDVYDWVSFVVDQRKGSITFYKNQREVVEVKLKEVVELHPDEGCDLRASNNLVYN